MYSPKPRILDVHERLPEQRKNRLRHDLVVLIPHVRAFSRILCRQRELAEDLAQEALLKAWRAGKDFDYGTNLKVWLFTTLRDIYYLHGRCARAEPNIDIGAEKKIEAPANGPTWTAESSGTNHALRRLTGAQREAVILVGAVGFSYKDAAKICNTNVGTMKGRVFRGRRALIGILDEIALPPCAGFRRDLTQMATRPSRTKKTRLVQNRVAFQA
jgi:RNA polymerase sigma-70 factor (ECF subfamily)